MTNLAVQKWENSLVEKVNKKPLEARERASTFDMLIYKSRRSEKNGNDRRADRQMTDKISRSLNKILNRFQQFKAFSNFFESQTEIWSLQKILGCVSQDYMFPNFLLYILK